MSVRVLTGHAPSVLATLPAESVQCVVTSPPYLWLRSYKTEPQVWEAGEGCVCAGAHQWGEEGRVSLRGADPGVHAQAGNTVKRVCPPVQSRGQFCQRDCACDWQTSRRYQEGGGGTRSKEAFSEPGPDNAARLKAVRWKEDASCARCGAWKGELGQEPTIALYVAHLCQVFRAVRRVLRDDGTLWVNLGDSYDSGTNAGRGAGNPDVGNWARGEQIGDRRGSDPSLQTGQRCLIPYRFALAMQQPYERRVIHREADRAWLAALVDGEGTISIHRKESYESRAEREGDPRCQAQYVPFLQIGNTDAALLERCIQITGYGNVRVKSEPHTDARLVKSRFTHYGWRLDGDKAIEVIRDIFPFLITKRRQAILANTLDISNKGGRALRGNKALPAEEQQKRELLKTLTNACNQREDGIVLPDFCREPDPVTIEPGWLLRSCIQLVKGAPMPEPVAGWRWQRCRVKKASNKNLDPEGRGGWQQMMESPERHRGVNPDWLASYEPCPGCAKCHVNDGYVLRRGQWRPVNATEVLLQFAKQPGYYGDGIAVREPAVRAGELVRTYGDGAKNGRSQDHRKVGFTEHGMTVADGRNAWDWLPWQHENSGLAHYAAYPTFIPRFAIQAGTSERGCCPSCGAPWARVVEERSLSRDQLPLDHKDYRPGRYPEKTAGGSDRGQRLSDVSTLGWRQTCACPAHVPIPCTVLDPFGGSGTTGLVADRLGRDAISIDLNSDYSEMAARRVREDAPLFAQVTEEAAG